MVADAEKEEDLIRKALSKIYEIRVIRHERRIQVILKNVRKFHLTLYSHLLFRQNKLAVRKL